MKIGVITFHFPFNCGAALQCYALTRTLEAQGHEVQVINYTPWYHWNRYASRKNPVYYAKKKWRDPARNVLTRSYHAAKGFRDTVRSWKGAKARLVREQKYTAFRSAHLHETRLYRTLKQLRAHPPKCDLYLAGSDQLWNTKLTDGTLDPAYLLDFGPESVRRVTYAVGTYFKDAGQAKKALAPRIGRLDAVSLREAKFLRPVMQAAGRDMPVHLDVDPTLLLDASDYETLLPRTPLEEKPFILVYTMPGPAQAQVNEAAKRLASRTGLHLIDVNGNPNARNREVGDSRIGSPEEFLWYVKHASYVMTNSFHGTVFSVLFEKPFATVLHKETGNRVSELLEKLGLSARCTDSTDAADAVIEQPVDWNEARAALPALRAESQKYLRWCCGGEAPAFLTEADLPPEPKPAPKPEPPKPDAPKPIPVREQIEAAERGRTMYTDDKNAQIVLSLLKQYNIRKIVVSPGTTNVPIARAAQTDPFFEAYSAVDERGAAYLAGGLAFATGEPVVISCTGATASRDYLPGLTEAYYRNLPVIAITSQHHSPCSSDLMPQMTDRTVSQNDAKRFAAILPLIKDDEDRRACIQLVNEALYTATRRDAGPVHINLPVGNLYSFTTKDLPKVQKIDVFDAEDFPAAALTAALSGKRVALFIGAHKPFDERTKAAIESFAVRVHAPVFCDSTANYTGKNRVSSAIAGDLAELSDAALPELLIDLGSVSGDYSATRLFRDVRTWRISEDRKFHNRQGVELVEKLFFCSERFFFEHLSDAQNQTDYYGAILESVRPTEVPQLPLSNIYAASKLAARLPKNSFLHLGILNSLRSMNFFAPDPSVTVSCNVGGFGIDGAVSTALGQSLADKTRLSFALIGDLAFFYDMNALGNRHVGSNLRILLINNARGVEFRLNAGLERLWGADTDDLIAAHGHFGSAKAWAEDMGFAYLSADTKESFDEQIDGFCDPAHFEKPVVFEVFTDAENEQDALKNLRAFNRATR